MLEAYIPHLLSQFVAVMIRSGMFSTNSICGIYVANINSFSQNVIACTIIIQKFFVSEKISAVPYSNEN